VYMNYTGIINITPALGAILGGSPDAKSTPFGDSCEYTPSLCPALPMADYLFLISHRNALRDRRREAEGSRDEYLRRRGKIHS